MTNRNSLALILVSICLLALSACGTGTASNDAVPSTPSDMNSQEDEDLGIEMLTGYLGASDYTVSSEGLYQIISNPGGGCNICYTDFLSGDTIYLCSQPNCVHNSDICNSWFQNSTLRLFPSLNREEIYYIASSDKGDQIWSMNQVGQNRQLLFQCATSESILDAVAGNAKYLYFSVMSMDFQEGLPYKQLVQLDLGTGKVSKLLEFPAQTWLFGAYKQTLLILYYGDSTFTYRTYDLQTQTLQDIYSYNVDEDGQGAFARPHGDALYIFEPIGGNKANLSKMNLENRNSEILVSDIDYFGSEFISVSGFYDDYMSVFITNPLNHNQKHYLIDWKSGGIYPIDLQYQQGDISVPVDIYAVANDQFVVNCGLVTQNIVLQNNDGTSYNSQVDRVKYAFIKKEDYVKNSFNITELSTPEAAHQ